MSERAELVKKIGDQFTWQLLNVIESVGLYGPGIMGLVYHRNVQHERDGSPVCASHEITSDANPSMAEAFRHVTGRVPNVEDETDRGLWNDAWSYARTTWRKYA